MRDTERGRDTGKGRGRSRLPPGSLMWLSIPKLQDHALSPRQSPTTKPSKRPYFFLLLSLIFLFLYQAHNPFFICWFICFYLLFFESAYFLSLFFFPYLFFFYFLFSYFLQSGLYFIIYLFLSLFPFLFFYLGLGFCYCFSFFLFIFLVLQAYLDKQIKVGVLLKGPSTPQHKQGGTL